MFVSVIYDTSKTKTQKEWRGNLWPVSRFQYPTLSHQVTTGCFDSHSCTGRENDGVIVWQPSDLFIRRQACSLANGWEHNRRRLRKESREDKTWIEANFIHNGLCQNSLLPSRPENHLSKEKSGEVNLLRLVLHPEPAQSWSRRPTAQTRKAKPEPMASRGQWSFHRFSQQVTNKSVLM